VCWRNFDTSSALLLLYTPQRRDDMAEYVTSIAAYVDMCLRVTNSWPAVIVSKTRLNQSIAFPSKDEKGAEGVGALFGVFRHCER